MSNFKIIFESENIYYIQLNGKDIGFYNEKTLEDGSYEIGNICIIPEYQGKGIGTKILEYIKEFAKENDCTDLYLTVNEENLNAIKLYEKFGFQLKNIAYSMKIK